MKDNRLKGIAALVVVTVISFVIIFATRSLVEVEEPDNGGSQKPAEGSLDIEGYDGIKEAWEIKDDNGEVTGYAVQASTKGFSGQVELQVDFELDGKTINNLTVVNQTETVGYGDNMTKEDYLSQFPGKVAPVFLTGEEPIGDLADAPADDVIQDDAADNGVLQDGVFRAEAADFVGGFLEMVTVKVEEGKIVSINWDAMNEDGEFKSYLSSVGEYKMTDDGPIWKDQVNELAAYVIENQDEDNKGVNIDDEGKTDSLATVSIEVKGFIGLLSNALEESKTGESSSSDSAGAGASAGGSQIDGITGATVSSVAIKETINKAQEFISDYLNK